MSASPDPAPALGRVRTLCLGLPEVEERLSHGHPTFFVRGKRAFVMFMDDHHGDRRLALWLAAPLGMQRGMVESAPRRYFVPPYVGHRGWLGLRLDRDATWDEVAAMIDEAYAAVAPRKLVAAAGLARAPAGD